MAKLVESRHSGCRVSVKVAILTGYAISTSRPNVFAGTCHEDRNMTLQHLTLDQIDQARLQRLIDGKTSERRDIEYKRATYGNADKDYGEYLADISSFANTVGGDIIIGMNAKAGVPTSFEPLQVDPMPKYCGLKTLLAVDFSRGSMALPYAISRLRLAVSFWWFAFREVTISRTALFDREPDITASMRDRRLESTSRTLMNFDCCLGAPPSFPIASETFDLTELPRSPPTTHQSPYWMRTPSHCT
jgi:hypothetical protein